MNAYEQFAHLSDSTAQHMLYCAVGFLISTVMWLTLGLGIMIGRWRRHTTAVKLITRADAEAPFNRVN